MIERVEDLAKDTFNIIKPVIIIFAIFIVIVILVVIIKKLTENSADKERKRKCEEEMNDEVRRFKEASKHWSVDQKIHYMNDICRKIEKLERSQELPIGKGYSTMTYIDVFINNELTPMFFDIKRFTELYYYLQNSL